MADLRTHADADADYVEAYLWYFRQDRGVANRFESEFEEALEKIRSDPDWWAVYDEQHRFVRVKGFPYHVIFRCEDETIWVVAVAHDRRAPDYWRGR